MTTHTFKNIFSFLQNLSENFANINSELRAEKKATTQLHLKAQGLQDFPPLFLPYYIKSNLTE